MDITSQSAKFQLETLVKRKKGSGFLKMPINLVLSFDTKREESITGYRFEPWHVRYVGNPQATYLYENQLTLEEVAQ